MSGRLLRYASRGWPACATIALVSAGALIHMENSAEAPDLSGPSVSAPIDLQKVDSRIAASPPVSGLDLDPSGGVTVNQRWPSAMSPGWPLSSRPGDARPDEPKRIAGAPPRASSPSEPEPKLARPAAADMKIVRQRPGAGNDLVPPPRIVRVAVARGAAEPAAMVLTPASVRPEQVIAQQRIPQGFPDAAEVPVVRAEGESALHGQRLALSKQTTPGDVNAVLVTPPAILAEAVPQDERNDAVPPQIAASPELGDTSVPRGDELASRLEQEPVLANAVRVSEPGIPVEETIEEARSDVAGPEMTALAVRLDLPVWREAEKMVGPAQTGELREEALLRATPASLAPADDQPMAIVSHARISSDPNAQPLTPEGLNLTIVSKAQRLLRGPRKSPADMLGLDEEMRVSAAKCLAAAVYFEARGEPISGQIAVAQVVLNRAFSGFYPRDICGVVYQNKERRLSCQFTFACDGKADAVRDNDSWGRAERIARDMLDGRLWIEDVGKSTHYHANWVAPWWTSTMKTKVEIGVHTFYRPRAWGDGARAPSWGDDAVSVLVPVSISPW